MHFLIYFQKNTKLIYYLFILEAYSNKVQNFFKNILLLKKMN